MSASHFMALTLNRNVLVDNHQLYMTAPFFKLVMDRFRLILRHIVVYLKP